MSSQHEDMPTSCNHFTDFFNNWLSRQKTLLNQLVDINDNSNSNSNSNDNEKSSLVQRVYSHYEEYYDEKSKVMERDIFQVFTQPWLTPFERAFLWLGGLVKPSLLLGLTEHSIHDIKSEQKNELARLKKEVVWIEKQLGDALAEVQESVGSPTLTQLIKNWRRLVDGEKSDFDEAIKLLKESLAKVVNEADNLRRFTVVKVGEILSVDQTIQFLAVVAKHQLRMRALGQQIDLLSQL